MAVEIMEIGDNFRKLLIFIIKGCFRLVRNHPFIVGILSFLIYLYRSFPFMFSLLVSSSPVLISAAILLGILLSYGESNIPEIEEIEKKTTRESMLVKKIEEVPLDSSVFEENKSFNVERHSDQLGSFNDYQFNPAATKIDEVHDEDDFADDTTPLIGERSRGIESDEDEVREGKQKLEDDITPLGEERSRTIESDDDEVCEGKQKQYDDSRNKQKIESIEDGEISEHHYAPIPDMEDEHLQVEHDDDDGDDRSETDSFDSEKVNVDSLDSPPHSPWSRIEEAEDREENEDDVSDSESDGSESSSPDASMAEIRPMLDELHPLLNEEASRAFPLPRDGSEHSFKSSLDNQESDDDEFENEEEEEDAKIDREQEKKSAITWTEEDQKNLMDLGSSEIERNLRLEHLIMRRRSRRNLVTERNLIDFEGFDLPFTIPSITTRRQNPFDLPEDPSDSGLPPIPGSAPSILLPRRNNPFDLPYDSSEEKPDLKGDDGFEEEFKTMQPRESFFRRYESFKVGPSSLAPERQHAARMRPYFVPERAYSEESNYSLFQRQSSGVSESKVSSVPETESLGSVDDIERKMSEDDDVQEPEAAITAIEEFSEEGSLRDHQLIISDAEAARDEDHVITHEPGEDVTLAHEPELLLKMEDAYEIGHGSESEEEEEDPQELGQVEQKDVRVLELETQLGDTSDHYQEKFITRQSLELESVSENVAQRLSRGSSSSSLSEVSERIHTEPEPEGFFIVEEEQHIVVHQERDIPTQNSVESPRLRIPSTEREQPIYDLSPREFEANLEASSSSISSVVPDLGLTPPMIIESSASSVEREIEHIIDEDVLHESIVVDDGNGACDLIESSRHQTQTQSQDEEHILISDYDAHNQDRDRVDIYTDADVYNEANERLGFTTSAEENTTLVSDKAVHEPLFDEHTSNNTADPYIPEHTNDMPKIVEEADTVIQIIDQELLSELDLVGDFSNNDLSNEVTDVVREIISRVSEVNEQADGIAMDKDETPAEYIVRDDRDQAQTQELLHQVEASTMLEDTDLPFEQINDEKAIDPISFEPNLVIETEQLELGPPENQSKGSASVSRSADEVQVQHPIESGKNTELDVLEHVTSESTCSPQELVTKIKAEDHMRSNTDDGSLDFQEDQVHSSTEELACVNDLGTAAVEDSDSITESHEAEEIPSGLYNLPDKQVLDCNTGEKHIEPTTDTIDSSYVAPEESSTKEEIGDVASNKPEDLVEEREYGHVSSSAEHF